MGHFGVWKRQIGIALGALALMGAAGAAEAQRRPDARAFTCEQARAFIWENGAAVLTTGRHTYDRFVAGERFCPSGYMAERAYVPTRDAQSCPIGYKCILDTRDEEFFRRFPPGR